MSCTVEAGGYILDRHYWTLADSHGTIIELTRLEYRLADVLMRNYGRAVPYNEIRSFLWPAANVSDVALPVYVNYLRAKLAKYAIETVRGVGYQFVGEHRQ